MATAISMVSPKHYLRAAAGRVFHVQTAAAGVAPGTALGFTAALALANPAGSGLDVIILDGRLAYVSGTLGAGAVYWGSVPGGEASGTEVPIRNALFGAEDSPAAARVVELLKAYSPATVVSPTAIRPFCGLGAVQGDSEVAPTAPVDEVNGGIIVPPGEALVLTGQAAAGTSPLVQVSMSFAVRPASDS